MYKLYDICDIELTVTECCRDGGDYSEHANSNGVFFEASLPNSDLAETFIYFETVDVLHIALNANDRNYYMSSDDSARVQTGAARFVVGFDCGCENVAAATMTEALQLIVDKANELENGEADGFGDDE